MLLGGATVTAIAFVTDTLTLGASGVAGAPSTIVAVEGLEAAPVPAAFALAPAHV